MDYTVCKEHVEAFWSRVDKSAGDTECWKWIGGRSSDVYGALWIPWLKKSGLAHRASFFLSNGFLPDGKLVCHSCDNPICCNPAHLWLGTNAENIQDCADKGRHPWKNGLPVKPEHRARGIRTGAYTHPESVRHGSEKSNAKLHESDIPHIRKSVALGFTNIEVAKKYGVSREAISQIINGRTWRHVK